MNEPDNVYCIIRVKNPLNFRQFSLSADPSKVANLSAFRLVNMLNSRQDLRFDNTFDISIKLFSAGAVRHRGANQRPAHTLAMAPTIISGDENHLTRVPPVGTAPPEDLLGTPPPQVDLGTGDQWRKYCISIPHDINQLCLPLAFLLGWHHICSRDNKFFNPNHRFNDLKGVKYSRGAYKAIVLCKEFLQQYGLDTKGPFSFLAFCKAVVCGCEEMATENKRLPVHVMLMDISTLTLIEQYPFKSFQKAISRPIIYLLKEQQHIYYITSLLNVFCSQETNFCFNCHRKWKNKPNKSQFHKWGHLCPFNLRNNFICIGCNRPLAKEDTFLDTSNSSQFCDGEITEEEINISPCRQCQTPFLSTNCKNLHERVCGVYGLYKTCCKKFIYVAQQVPGKMNVTDIRLHHQCNNIACKYCQVQYPRNEGYKHHCMIKPIEQQNHTWVAFAYFMEQNECQTNCYSCFQRANNCKLHRFNKRSEKSLEKCFTPLEETEEAEVNLISFAYQKEKCFQTQIFHEKNIKITTPLEKQFESSGVFQIPENSMPYNHATNQRESEIFLSNESKGEKVIDQFLRTLLTLSKKSKFTIYLNLFALCFMLQCLVTHNLIPVVLQKDGIFLSLTLLNMKFINMNVLFNNLFILKNYAHDLHFFPLPLNSSQLYAMINTNKPPLRFFLHYNDTEQLRKLKILFWEKLQTTDWLFGNELARCATSWILIYYKLFKMYLELAQSLQSELSLAYQKPMEIWNPLTKPFITSTAFLHKLMITLADFKSHKLFSVRHGERGIYHRSSLSEFQFIQFMIHTNDYDLNKCEYAYNMPHGTIRRHHCYPDLTVTTSTGGKIYYFYHGCFFHQHKADKSSVCLNQRKMSFIDNSRFKSHKKKMDYFKEKCVTDGSKVYEVWECQFKEKIKTSLLYENIKESFSQRPMCRLIPRLACKGPVVEAYHCLWQWSECCNVIFYVLDKVKFYLSIMATLKICRNDYNIYIAQCDMEKIVFNKEKKVYQKDGVDCYGLAQVRVYPPRKCIFPIISYKQMKNTKFPGIRVTPICKTCCQLNTKRPCGHNEFKRSFIGHLTFLEINYAIQLGYKFIFYEAYLYDIEPPECIFATFAKKVEEISQRYQKGGPDDQIKAKLMKMMIVGALGRFGLHPEQDIIQLVDSLEKFTELIDSKEITDIFECTKNALFVSTFKKSWWRKNNPTTCLTISAYITAAARIEINQIMYKIQKAGGIVYLASTDCLYFTLSKKIPTTSSKFPLQISSKMGDFAYELSPKIKRVCILGPRNYAIVYEDIDGKIQLKVVMGGFSLTRTIMKIRKLDFAIIKSMVISYIENFKIPFPTVDIIKKKPGIYKTLPLSKRRTNYSRSLLVKLNKENYCRKQILKYENVKKKYVNYCYLPFGYVQK
jgi:G:T-mismatch repair DNA endonuclease (very short patch repair protein)